MPDDPVPTLFGPLELDEKPAAVRRALPADMLGGPFAAVAIEQSIDKTLDYVVPPRLVPSIQIGQRVQVPLGRKNKPAHGYVVAVKTTTDYADPSKLKSLLGIDDQRVLVPPSLMELAV